MPPAVIRSELNSQSARCAITVLTVPRSGTLCSLPDDDASQAAAGDEHVPGQKAETMPDQQTQTGAEYSTTGGGDAEADDEDFESFKKKHEEEEALSAMTGNVEEGAVPRKCSSYSTLPRCRAVHNNAHPFYRVFLGVSSGRSHRGADGDCCAS